MSQLAAVQLESSAQEIPLIKQILYIFGRIALNFPCLNFTPTINVWVALGKQDPLCPSSPVQYGGDKNGIAKELQGGNSTWQ